LYIYDLPIAGCNNFCTILGLDINPSVGSRSTSALRSKVPVTFAWLISLIQNA
jgi:hypothetical protein